MSMNLFLFCIYTSVCGLTCSLFKVSVRHCSLSFSRLLASSQGYNSLPQCFSPAVLPDLWKLPWLFRHSSASFQLVFLENYFACRCILDVFVSQGELHFLLLHHVDSQPEIICLNNIREVQYSILTITSIYLSSSFLQEAFVGYSK